MKQNLYYRSTFARKNMFTEWFLNLFLFFSSPALLLLEVFTRKNFGERYFRLSSVLSVTVMIGILPVLFVKVPAMLGSLYTADTYGIEETAEMAQAYPAPVQTSLMPAYLCWYIFLALFLALGVKHKMDILRNPSVFDFAKFSLYKGNINPFFYRIKLPLIETTPRVVECILEPAVFFIAGVFFWLIGQNLGILLIVISLLYAYSYVAFYREGDHFVMDKIDQIISNEELEAAFVLDKNDEETRGFTFRGRKPKTETMRRQILPLFTQEDDILEAK